MRGVARHSVFMADPVGAYLVGRQWVYWCARPDRYGLVLWGRPDADAMAALCRALAVELGPGVVPHASLIDARRLESVDADAFAVLDAYVRTNHAVLSERVTRLALVRPEGMVGAIAAGFYEVVDPPYPVSVFEDVGEALGWLGDDPGDPLLAEIDALYATHAGVQPIVGRLRAMLMANLSDVDMGRAARGLSLSERTLQRRLRAAGTTFQRELMGVRIGEAKRRMLETDASLTSIALEVGFTSSQHLSARFRAVVGESPSQWRARSRSDSL